MTSFTDAHAQLVTGSVRYGEAECAADELQRAVGDLSDVKVTVALRQSADHDVYVADSFHLII